MKVLFICAQNRGRSQMAAELYNKLTHTHNADSAGTVVDTPHRSIAERAKVSDGAQNVIDVMYEEGIDVSENLQTPISEDLINQYDSVVVMAEDHTIPDYLRHHTNFIYWDVEDPAQKGFAGTRDTKELIKSRVQAFIQATS